MCFEINPILYKLQILIYLIMMMKYKKTFFVAVFFGLLSCTSSNSFYLNKKNILWVYLEDTAPLMGAYGERLIETPNIDKLAENGVLYTNAFMPSPVCSASRSTIITGMMATTLGLHNHHSSRTQESEIKLPKEFKTIPEIFKKTGYFTFNNGKDDYNFSYNRHNLYSQEYKVHPLYGKLGLPIDFSELTQKQPFFGQVQLSGGKEIFKKKFQNNISSPVDRSKIKLPPYLPNNPVLIEEYAKHYDAIQITDKRVGEIINGLKENKILNNTIVFFFSDHGMRITRNKQFLYDGGLNVPLIIADFTNQFKPILKGTSNGELVSGLDIGATSLAIAEIEIPDIMEGRNLFTDPPRDYVISTRDRCDFTIDRIRSVRTKNFKYIKNFMTDRPYTQPTYMDVNGVEFVKTIRKLKEQGKLNSVQERFLSDFRPSEELYDIENDPFELKNLAFEKEYELTLKAHAKILEDWILKTDDKGQYPENEENLKFMLEIWGDHVVNPEYEVLKNKYPGIAGSKKHILKEQYK
jgi:arylsulfatase A-like enzyme